MTLSLTNLSCEVSQLNLMNNLLTEKEIYGSFLTASIIINDFELQRAGDPKILFGQINGPSSPTMGFLLP